MPHTEPQLSLRQLVHAFTTGRIDKHTYRSRRARLLDGLTSKKFAQPLHPSKAEMVGAVHNHPAPALPQKPPLVLIIAIVVIALLITILGLNLLMAPEDQSGIGENDLAQQQTSAAKQPVTTMSQKVELENGIKAFVRSNTWDDTSNRRLLTLWNRTDPGVRATVKNSYWFRALDTELRTLIKEELGLSSSNSVNRVDTLMAFGANFGLSYPEFASATRSPTDNSPSISK
ncbi:MAG: hypothetical protein RPT95_17350 [Candidatus Sedimenticola sp. (ex Thyasira tokunagai)]